MQRSGFASPDGFREKCFFRPVGILKQCAADTNQIGISLSIIRFVYDIRKGIAVIDIHRG